MIGSAILIGLNIYPMYKDISDTAITAFFQASSIMTTAGFSTVDFNLWPSFSKMIHPRSVSTVKFEGKPLDDTTVNGIGVYFVIYFVLFFAILLLISLNGFDFETTFTAVATTFNNIGPGLAGVGPMASFAEFSPFSKIVLSFAMLLGRLEIFPILLLFTPFLWKRK